MLSYFRSMEAFFHISLPSDWLSLSDRQLLFFFRLLSHDLQIEEVLTVCLFKWADLRLLCRTANGSYLVKQRHRPKQEATLTLQQIQSATAALDYLRSFPSFPIRITKIGKARPLEADFQRIPFATFISCDNYYQGFLQSKDEERLKDLTLLLYLGIKPRCLTRPILYSLLLVRIAEAILRPTVSALPAADTCRRAEPTWLRTAHRRDAPPKHERADPCPHWR